MLLPQRKTEEAELVDEEAKKAKPSEETNGEGGEPNGKEAESDEQAPVSYIHTAHAFLVFHAFSAACTCEIRQFCFRVVSVLFQRLAHVK